MPDAHGHPHSHSHGVDGKNPRLGVSIVLTLVFVVVEAVAGYLASSLALMSDAGHNFSDALALVLSWYGVRAAKRPATAERTFGSHRVGILAALANALTLVAIGAVIIWEAIHRLLDPEPVQSGPMIWVAVIAVILNGVISVWLRAGAKTDLNLRSAYLHMLGDAVSALGVVVAGIIVGFTGSPLADPVVSLLIGVAIIWSSWGIITEAVNILLEAVPKGVDMEALERSVKAVPGVVCVHDFHVWSISSEHLAASLHVLVSEQSVSSGEQILKVVSERLRHNFGIGHTTIQVEVEGCAVDEMYCTLRPTNDSHSHHNHPH
jgi:cobalt-zinc-cadmium efflux system protein